MKRAPDDDGDGDGDDGDYYDASAAAAHMGPPTPVSAPSTTRTTLIVYPNGEIRPWTTTVDEHDAAWPPLKQGSDDVDDQIGQFCARFGTSWLTGPQVSLLGDVGKPQTFIRWQLLYDDCFALNGNLKENPKATQLAHRFCRSHVDARLRVFGTCVLRADFTYCRPHSQVLTCYDCPVHLHPTDIDLLLCDASNDKTAVVARAAITPARCGRHHGRDGAASTR